MPNPVAATLFLTFFSALVASSHYYVWHRLVQLPQWPAPIGAIAGGLLLAVGLSLPLTMLVVRVLAASSPRNWMALTFGWMGVFFIVLNATFATDLLRLGLRGGQALGVTLPAGWPNGLIATRGFALFALVLAAAATASAYRTARGGPIVERVTVKLARLPAGMAPFTVAQISDLHVAMMLRRPYVEQVVRQVMALEPQLIVLTGDLMDGSVAALADDIAPLGQLKAPYGVFGITGNHEYYSGAEPWMAALQALGIAPLRNARVHIAAPGGGFDLAGIDDPAGRMQGGGADLVKALQGRDAKQELVLLAHQPKLLDQAVGHGVGLMLSGHTHGGQIFPFGLLVKLAQPFLAGLHRRGDTQVYVNRGTGYWGPPLRLGAPAEITLLTLTPSA